MLGKNNFAERLRKMEMQNKQERFSIRKLTIGAASVLLGFTFLGANSQGVKADTIISARDAEKSSQTEDTTSELASSRAKDKHEQATKPDLSTYRGLSLFLKETPAETDKVTTDKDTTESTNVTSAEPISKPTSPVESTTQVPANDSHTSDQDQPAADITTADQDSAASAKPLPTDATKPEIVVPQADTATEVEVQTWDALKAALKNANVSLIKVTDNIAAPNNLSSDLAVTVNGERNLMIESYDPNDPKRKYTIDFRANDPKPVTGGGFTNANSHITLTYSNISLYSSTYYGVANTANMAANLNFNNINFHGTQLAYFYTPDIVVHFSGENLAETVTGSYTHQQLLEFSSSSNNKQELWFDSDSTFEASTIGGNVIQMSGANAKVNIGENAHVTLNPAKNAPEGTSEANKAETTNKVYGIYLEGGTLDVGDGATLDINIGNPNFTGTLDNMQAAAISLNNANSSIDIHHGAVINITTNGDISSHYNGNANTLFYDKGNLNIHSGGALNITGTNMQKYAGTLVLIAGTANLNNGTFKVQLLPSAQAPADASLGAGTGALNLIDVKGGTLVVTNPQELLLDASGNTNAKTSVITSNKIKLTNVRQQTKNYQFTLPNGQKSQTTMPLHEFDIHNSANGIVVDDVVSLSQAAEDAVRQYVAEVYNAAGSPEHNYVHFVSANPKGFLDIANAAGEAGKVDIVLNADGSRTVSGQVLNFTAHKDDPTGTNTFITAQFVTEGELKDQYIVDDKLKSPYQSDKTDDQPDEFATQVKDDGMFSFTIPADQTVKLRKGDKLKLTPNANFVSYNPTSLTLPASDAQARPLITDLSVQTLGETQDSIASDLNAAAQAAITRIKAAKLDSSKQGTYISEISNTLKAAIAKTTDPNYDQTKSIYGTTSIVAANERKQRTLDQFDQSAARAELEAFVQSADPNANSAYRASLNKGKAAIKAASGTIAINDARDNAMANVLADYQSWANNEIATSAGVIESQIADANLSTSLKQRLNTAVTNANGHDSIMQATTIGVITNIKNRVVGSFVDFTTRICALSEFHNAVANLQTAFPDSADSKFSLNLTSVISQADEAIFNETEITNLQDPTTYENANSDNREDVPDIKAGITQVKNAIVDYKNKFKQDLNNQITNGDLLNLIDQVANGAGIDNTQSKVIVALKDKLQQALDIAATQTTANTDVAGQATIDKASDEQTVNSEYQKAQAIITEVTNRLTAIKTLQTTRDNQVAANPDEQEIIDHAFNTAVATLITSDLVDLNQAQTAGVAQINSVAKLVSAQGAIRQEATKFEAQYPNYQEELEAAKKQALSGLTDLTDVATIMQKQADGIFLIDQTAAQIAIKQEAAAQIAKYPDSEQAITTAKETALANLTAATTTAVNLDQIQTAGLVAIDRIGAMQDLATAEHDIENKINTLTGLTSLAKADYLASLQSFIQDDNPNSAAYKMQHAVTVDELNISYSSGIRGMNTIFSAATLASKKSEANATIKSHAADIKQKIAALGNLTPDQITSYQAQVDSYYNSGTEKVAEATSTDGVATAQTTATDYMDNVLQSASVKDQTALQTVKDTAIGKLQAIVAGAINKVNAIADGQVSANDKQKYIDQINTAFNTTKDRINSSASQTVIDDAEQEGETAISSVQVAAQVAADKASALAELSNHKATDLAAINQLFSDGKISAADKANYLTNITGYYDTGVANVNKAQTSTAITQYKNSAVSAMDSVVSDLTSNVNEELRQAKEAALKALDETAREISKVINRDENLSLTEKEHFDDDLLSAALQEAKTNVQNSKNLEDVKNNQLIGGNSLTAIKTAANLQSAKNAALKELLAEQTNINNAIDSLTSISNDVKTSLKQKVQTAYQTACNGVNDPVPATVEQISKEKETGLDAMDDVLTAAQSVSEAIATNQAKLDQFAQSEIAAISDTNPDKQQIVTAINEALETAKSKLALLGNDSKTTTKDVTNAEKQGEQDIITAEANANKTVLSQLKQEYKDKFDTEVQQTLASLQASYESLSEGGQSITKYDYELAKQQVADAKTKTDDAITAANNRQSVVNAFNDGEQLLNESSTAFNVVVARQQACTAIYNEGETVKKYLDDSKNKDRYKNKRAVDQLVQGANTQLNAATDIATITQIRDNTVKAIDQVKLDDNDEALKQAKAKATANLDKLFNGDGAKKKGLLAELDALSNLPSDEKAKYKKNMTSVYNLAVSFVNGCSEIYQVESGHEVYSSELKSFYDQANLKDSQIGANDELDRVSSDAINAVMQTDDSILSKDEKVTVISSIGGARDRARDKIAACSNARRVSKSLKDGTDEIQALLNSAKNKELRNAQSVAIAKINAKAETIRQQINADLLASTLTQAQHDELFQQVTSAVNAATSNINLATDVTNVNSAETTGEAALAQISNQIDIEVAYTTALNAIQATADQTNQKIDQINADHDIMDGATLQHLKSEVESERKKAISAVNTTKPNGVTAINTAKTAGIAAINGVMDNIRVKTAAIDNLQAEADKINTDLTNLTINLADPTKPLLSDSQVETARTAIDQALKDGVSKIYAAHGETAIQAAQNAGIILIDGSILPSKLLIEQNKQIAAINAYAAGEHGIGALAQLDNLTADEKQDLTQQINTAKQKAIDKITAITLPKQPTQADFNAAKQAIANAEKGIPNADEVANFGEAGIDKIVATSNLDQQKRTNIAKLNAAVTKLKSVIDSTDWLSDIEKTNYHNKINLAADQAIDNITNAKTDAESGQAYSDGTICFNNIVFEAANNSYRNGEINNLNAFKQNAYATIDRSQLTPEQKAAAKDKINAVFTAASADMQVPFVDENNNPIAANTYQNQVHAFEQAGEVAISQVLAKNNSDNDPWFNNEIENTADLTAGYNDLTTEQKQNYSDLVTVIEKSLDDLANTKNIAQAIVAYDQGLTALNKLKAKDQVKQAAEQAEQLIDQNPNLSNANKELSKGKVKQAVKAANNTLDNVLPNDNDVIGNQERLNEIVTTAQGNITAVVTQAGLDDANELISTGKDAFIAMQAAYNSAQTKLGKNIDQSKLDSTYLSVMNQMTSLQVAGAIRDYILTGVKTIDQAALEAAADAANVKINNLKHDDGKDFTTNEKQAIKKLVAKDLKNGKEQILNAESAEVAEMLRDATIDQILKDYTDTATVNDAIANDPTVMLDQEKAKAKADLAKIYQAAKEKLQLDFGEKVALTNLNSKYAAATAGITAREDTIDSIIAEIAAMELAGEQMIAQGAVADAQVAANQLIETGNYTTVEQQALNNQVVTLASVDFTKLTDSEAITAKRNDTIDQISKICQDATTANNILTNDLTVQKAKALNDLAAAYQRDKEEFQNNFGLKAPVAELDQQYTIAKNKIKAISQASDLAKAEITGEQKLAQAVVNDTQTEANNLIAATNYSENQKAALVAAVAKEATRRDFSKYDDSTWIDMYCGQEIAAIKRTCSDKTTINNIFANNSAVQNEKLEQAKTQADSAIDQAVTTANQVIESNQDYTKAEKTALKNKVKQAADSGKGEIANQTTITGVETERDKAITQIQNDSTVQATINDIFDQDLGVQQERLDQKIKTIYDQAVAKLDAEFDESSKSNVNEAYNKHKEAQGKTVAELKADALKAEREIAQGAITDAVANAEQLIDQLKHENGNSFTAAEQAALMAKFKQDADINFASMSTSAAITTARDAAIKQIRKDCTDVNTINTVLGTSNDVQLSQGKTQAESDLLNAYEAAVNKLQGEFGDNVALDKLDAAYAQAKKNLADTTETNQVAIIAVQGEKVMTQGAIADAVVAANAKITNSKRSEADKEALKKQVAKDAEAGESTVADANDIKSIGKVRDQAIEQISRDCSDADVIDEIINGDLTAQKTKANQQIKNIYDAAVAKLKLAFGNTVDTSKVADAYENHKEAQGDTGDALKADVLKAEKELAQGAVNDAVANAQVKINAGNYTKDQQAILMIKANQAAQVDFDKLNTSKDVTNTRDQTIDQISKVCSDQVTIDAILSEDLANQLMQAKAKAKTEITTAMVVANEQISNNTTYSEEEKAVLHGQVQMTANTGNEAIDQQTTVSGVQAESQNVINRIKQIAETPSHPTNSGSDISAPIKPVENDDFDQGDDVTLMHNAYVYNEAGVRANKVVIGAGSVVTTYGTKLINDREYYVLTKKGSQTKQYYLDAANVKPTNLKLKHNAKIYNKYGNTVKNSVILKAGKTIATYGSPIKIRGKQYYIIGNGRYVKAANVESKITDEAASLTIPAKQSSSNKSVSHILMHNAYLYDEQGKRANGIVLNANSVVETTGKEIIGRQEYYRLSNGLYIAAGNIDAARLKLTHNAYLYSKYGNRQGKQVLNKHQIIATYGDPIIIKQQKYYILGNGKYIKAANFE